MTVLSEKKLCAFLGRVLELSTETLKQIPEQGTQTVTSDHQDRFHGLVNDLAAERENDTYLNDEAWDWIWEGRTDLNYIQLYGRLAWVNLQLLQLL